MKETNNISVKHFFNTELKPIKIYNNQAYPLYVHVSHKQKSTRFKSRVNNPEYSVAVSNNIFKARKHKEYNDLFQQESNTIKRIIEFESESDTNFSLIGLGSRYDEIYSRIILDVFDKYMVEQLSSELAYISPRYWKAFNLETERFCPFYLLFDIIKNESRGQGLDFILPLFSEDFNNKIEIYYFFLQYVIGKLEWKYDKLSGLYTGIPCDIKVIDWLTDEKIKNDFELYRIKTHYDSQISEKIKQIIMS